MDEADAEEAARATGSPATREGPSLTLLRKQKVTTPTAIAPSVEVQRDLQQQGDGMLEEATKSSAENPRNEEPAKDEVMDVNQDATALPAGKRTHEESAGEKSHTGGGSDETLSHRGGACLCACMFSYVSCRILFSAARIGNIFFVCFSGQTGRETGTGETRSTPKRRGNPENEETDTKETREGSGVCSF